MISAPTLTATIATSPRDNKVPEIALTFWIIKIAATTLGETGGDAVSMTLNLGYAVGSLLFIGFFIVAAAAQIRASAFRPFLYWTVVVATTTAGTTMADFADRSLGIGYLGGSLLLAALTFGTLALWRFTCGSVAVDAIRSPKVEIFYWTVILFSNTLGTALGDWLADAGLGYEGGALVFAFALAGLALAYVTTSASRTLLFWAAFVLTRPLGATVGDMLTKPHAAGGLDLSRISSSVVILAFMVACIIAFPQRTSDHPAAREG